MSIGLIVKGIRKSKSLSQKDIATKIGVSLRTYLGFETEGKDLPFSKVQDIAHLLNLDLATFNKSNTTNSLSNIILQEDDFLKGKVSSAPIPLLKFEVIGGFANDTFTIREEDVEAYYLIPEFKHLDIEFMMRVRGSSMYPSYNSGDIVACSVIRSSQFIQWNKIHVVATREQGIILKRIEQGSRKDTLTMVSDNEKYRSFEIPKSEITGLALVEGGVKLE